MPRRQIDLATIEEHLAAIEQFNRVDLSTVDLIDNGKKIRLSRPLYRRMKVQMSSNVTIIRERSWAIDLIRKQMRNNAAVRRRAKKAKKA